MLAPAPWWPTPADALHPAIASRLRSSGTTIVLNFNFMLLPPEMIPDFILFRARRSTSQVNPRGALRDQRIPAET
jgi:hypothetical protein